MVHKVNSRKREKLILHSQLMKNDIMALLRIAKEETDALDSSPDVRTLQTEKNGEVLFDLKDHSV